MLLLRTAAEASTINAPIVEVVFKSSKTDPLRNDDKASSEESAASFVQILGNIFFQMINISFVVTSQWASNGQKSPIMK